MINVVAILVGLSLCLMAIGHMMNKGVGMEAAGDEFQRIGAWLFCAATIFSFWKWIIIGVLA